MPQVSCTILRCVGDDPPRSFDSLVEFVRRSMQHVGRAIDVRVLFESTLSAQDTVDDLGMLGELGFDELYCVVREVWRTPGWIAADTALADLFNELVLVVRRSDLVVVCGRTPTSSQFRKWIDRNLAPVRFFPPANLGSAFPGDGKMVWVRGIHRPRSTKPDSKALGGIRVQDASNPVEDSTFVVTAAKVDFQPGDESSVLRDHITVSPEKSRMSWKRASTLPLFLAVVAEALARLEKALVDADEPEPVFPDYAVDEKDLNRVRDAFEVVVVDPDELRGAPDAEDEQVEAAEALLDVVLEVRPRPGSPAVEIDVGYEGAKAGTLVLKPVAVREGFAMDVGIVGTPLHEPVLREIKETIGDGTVLAVHYQSGHVFRNCRILRENLVALPFREVDFEDFTGFAITREKPRQEPGESLHEAIGLRGDDSLFGWALRHYRDGWLLCDDGAGEVADFLHLSDSGALKVIHIKAAGSATDDRRIAVARFEQVVSQAQKNLAYLANDTLVDRLTGPRIDGSAAWHDGVRVPAADFVQQLRVRVPSDSTQVVIVQPHLLRSVHRRARADADANLRTRDSAGLALLDNLLHSARQSIIGRCDDLRVIGCA